MVCSKGAKQEGCTVSRVKNTGMLADFLCASVHWRRTEWRDKVTKGKGAAVMLP